MAEEEKRSHPDRRELTDLDNRVRDLNSRLGEVERDLLVKLKGIDTTIANGCAEATRHALKDETWQRRQFWVFVITLGFHIATLMWLAVLSGRATAIQDEWSKAETLIQTMMERSTERFARIEAELRTMRFELENAQKRAVPK